MKKNGRSKRLVKVSALAILLAATAKIESSLARSPVPTTSQTTNLLSGKTWSLLKVADKDTSTFAENNSILQLSIDPASTGQQLCANFTLVSGSKLSRKDNSEFGKALHLHFSARSTTPHGMKVLIAQSKYPYAQTLAEYAQIDREWREFDYDCIAPTTRDQFSLCFKPKASCEIKE